MSSARRWRYLSEVRLRCAGFPFDWLERLSSPALIAAQERFAQADAVAREQRVKALCTVAASASVTKTLERLTLDLGPVASSKIPRGVALEAYQTAAAARAEAATDLEAQAQLALSKSRVALAHFAADPRVAEAIGIMSASAATQLPKLAMGPSVARAKRERHSEQMLWLYLQRLCAKNDTHSFFGPVVWGVVDSTSDPVVRLEFPDLPLDRRVFFERWAVAALAAAISKDPHVRPLIPPRLSPMVRLEGNALFFPVGASAQLEPETAAVLRACDGRRTAAEICLAAGTDLENGHAELEALVDAKAVRWALGTPTGLSSPQGRLSADLGALAAAAGASGSAEWLAVTRWQQALEQLEQLRCRSQTAEWPQRGALWDEASGQLERLTQGPSRRGGGDTYAGRGLFHEDCGKSARLTLGARFLAALEPLEPLHDISSWIAHRVVAGYRAKFCALLPTLPVRGAGVDLICFLEASAKVERTGEVEAQVLAEVAQRWEGLSASGAGTVQWPRAQLDRLRDALGPLEEVEGFFDGSFHSPDVLIAARDLAAINAGDFQVVVGETHRSWMTLLAAGGLPFCANLERLGEQIRAGLPALLLRPVEPARTYNARRQVFPTELFNLHELDWDDAVPRVEGGRTRRAADLIVLEERGELYVASADGTERYPLFATLESSLVGAVLSLDLPLATGAHQPRLVCERLVLQRERWRLERPLLEAGEGVAALASHRHAHALPARLFCKVPEENKPFFVDFGNPISLEHFARVCRGEGPMVLSEMLPGPEQLWIEDPLAGGRVTGELRLTVRAG